MIWATVSSWSCFCWLYRASPFGCKEYNQSDFGVYHLVMSMCRVFSCVVGRGCLLWPVCFLVKESDTTERLHFHFLLSCIGEGNGNPLQCSCRESPRDGGACWAAVYGVAQSWTWLSDWTELNWTDGYYFDSNFLHVIIAVINFVSSILVERVLVLRKTDPFTFPFSESDNFLFYLLLNELVVSGVEIISIYL